MGMPSGSAISGPAATAPAAVAPRNSLLERCMTFSPRTRSDGLRVPTRAVLAREILVGLRDVGNRPGLGVVEQPLAGPQRDGVEVDGLRNRARVEEGAGRMLHKLGPPS